MKRLFSILLILMTAFYVLPVSNGMMADTEPVCKYTDKNMDESKDSTKDCSKEFIPGTPVAAPLKNYTAAQPMLLFTNALPAYNSIEIPPPDRA